LCLKDGNHNHVSSQITSEIVHLSAAPNPQTCCQLASSESTQQLTLTELKAKEQAMSLTLFGD